MQADRDVSPSVRSHDRRKTEIHRESFASCRAWMVVNIVATENARRTAKQKRDESDAYPCLHVNQQ